MDLVQEKILKLEDAETALSSRSWNLFVKKVTRCSLLANNGLWRVMQLLAGERHLNNEVYFHF